MSLFSALIFAICAAGSITKPISSRADVRVGEVKSDTTGGNLDLPTMLRGSLERELKQIDLSHVHTSVIVSATVVRFDVGDRTQECAVTSAIRTRDGRLLASLSGRAVGSSALKPELILDQAVHGAISNLTRVLQ